MTMSLTQEIKEALVTTLMLDVSAEDIADDMPLFGPAGLGLDSVDALQVTVEIEKRFGYKITDHQLAKSILQSVQTIAQAIEAHRATA
jgi:acyl carrier protein